MAGSNQETLKTVYLQIYGCKKYNNKLKSVYVIDFKSLNQEREKTFHLHYITLLAIKCSKESPQLSRTRFIDHYLKEN